MKKNKDKMVNKNLTVTICFLLTLLSPQLDIAENQFLSALKTQKKTVAEIVIPPKIYCISGRPLNIYFDNLIIGDYKDYLWDIKCEVGFHQNERWHFESGPEKEIPLEISIYNKQGGILDAKKTTLLIKKDKILEKSKIKCLFMGHSIIAAGIMTRELINLFSKEKSNFTLIGTKGKEPNLHEGHSGWNLDAFFSREDSPFVFGKNFDFRQYMDVHQYTGLNYLFICLGITDFFNIRTDQLVEEKILTMLKHMNAIFKNIHDYDKKIKIGIMISIPPAYYQDGFGAFMFSHTGQTRWRYKRNIIMWAKKIIETFKKREDENIYLVPINVNLDTIHNMAEKMVPINSRTNKKILRQIDPVHPAKEGHFQLTDVIFSFIKYMEISNSQGI